VFLGDPERLGSRSEQRVLEARACLRLPRGKIISVDPTLLLAEISHSVWWKSTTLICVAKKQVHKISEIS